MMQETFSIERSRISPEEVRVLQFSFQRSPVVDRNFRDCDRVPPGEETPTLSWLDLNEKIRKRLKECELQPEKWEAKAEVEEIVGDLKYYDPEESSE